LTKKQLKLARRYGLAIRLARRLGGGPIKPLKHAELTVTNKNLELKIDESLEPFMGQHIEKLLDKLADNMGLNHIY
ncbi:MAG: Ppx/GppA family phosphatase, partial [Alphaproteobacteria bacterium]